MNYFSLIKSCCAKKSQLKQIFRIMWMTSFLLFFCSTLFLFAENSYSQNARVTIKERNVPLETVLDEIENQSDYLFIYDGNQVDVNKNVSVNAKSQPVSEVLTDLLADSQVKYVMEGTHIVLLAEGATSSASPQQTQSVSGVVTDATGEPLAGVSIAVKGTTIGAITDVDGKYSISVPSEESVLTFSFIGFTSQEITAGNRRTINVELKENVQQIEDVVVIGYGTVKKSDLTGSVASISNRQFQNQPLSRVDDILKGRTPGAMVLTNSGSPDKNISVRIRGANSIYGGNDPLYIIDGVPSGTLDANTNDIQSIEVLKDASATAIYGSRGANGVILITTKRGAEGKTQIQLETQNSWSSLYKKFDMLSAADFAESYNEFRNGTFTQDQINAFKAGTAGTDWQDLIFRTAYSQNHKLTISGGTNKARYYISGNFEDNQGVVIESDMRRYALRSNIQADVTNWLKVDMDLNGYSKKTSGLQGQPGSVGSPVADALMYSPVTDLKDAKGNWLRDQFCSLSQNPYGRLVQNPNDSYWNGLTGNLKLTFLLPVKGLTFNMQGAATYTAWSNFYLNSLLYNLTDQDSAGNSRNDGWDFYNLDQLNYTHQWGDHRLTAMVAGEFTKSVSSGLSGSQSYLLTESVGYWNLSMGDTSQGAPILSNWYNDQQMASVFGRGEYSFKDRYLLTATIRRDGSSKFQGKNKWGNFPSASLAWRAAEESFIKNLNVFDNLKLRLSYGVTGSQAINPYGTLGLLASTSSTWGDPAANYLMGYYIGSPAAPNLTWEKTYQYDLGLDLGFFHNRLSASIDIYQKTTKGLLLQKPIPLYDGGGSMWVNLGQVRNKGIDLQLSGIILQSRDWHWESTFNFSYNKNAVLDLGGQERMEVGSAIANGMSINTAVLEVGQPMGSIQGYTWLGLWKTSEADEAAKMGQQPGDNHFKDFNGDGVIDANDISVIGHAFPDKILGWNNTVSWRRFDLNVMFQGAFGADRLNIGRYLMNVPNSDVKWMTGAEGWFNRWTPDNENTWVPNPFSTTSNLHSESQQFLESANYVRLSNLSIAYTLPKSLIKFCDLTLMLSAQNLVTFTGYKGGDPESTMSSFGKLPGTVQGNTDTNAGIDAISYPQPRSFTVGAKLSF
jgi:TonB-linked SusC/RagA family outer membrane protein